MEPAVEQREHPVVMCDFSDELDEPQWNPPSNGGSTMTNTVGTSGADLPQWSPPSDGGSTRLIPGEIGAVDQAAMQPAAER